MRSPVQLAVAENVGSCAFVDGLFCARERERHTPAREAMVTHPDAIVADAEPNRARRTRVALVR